MDVRATDNGDMSPVGMLADRLGRSSDARLATFVVAAIEGIVQAGKRVGATRDDYNALIAFLTNVGEACSDKRQEWVLLADVLGLTSGLERHVTARPSGATPNALAGPFYRKGAPRKRDGDTISIDGKGQALAFRAMVEDLDGEAVPGALVEIWQANSEGLYENQAPDLQPEFNLRGSYSTGRDGAVLIRTVKPGGYSIPIDGPVGGLMKRLGLSPVRPAHIQFRVSAKGFQTLTTHVFDRDDPAIARDPLFAVHPSLLAAFRPVGESLETEFSFVLARARPDKDDF